MVKVTPELMVKVTPELTVHAVNVIDAASAS